MCAVEDAEPWDFCHGETRTARKPHRCVECGRGITPGERYEHFTGVMDGQWSKWRWCQHCEAVAAWMRTVCGGYLIGDLRDEMREHWHEGFVEVAFGRLIAGIRWQWHGGRDPVPTGVGDLARRMMQGQVAA